MIDVPDPGGVGCQVTEDDVGLAFGKDFPDLSFSVRVRDVGMRQEDGSFQRVNVKQVNSKNKAGGGFLI